MMMEPSQAEVDQSHIPQKVVVSLVLKYEHVCWPSDLLLWTCFFVSNLQVLTMLLAGYVGPDFLCQRHGRREGELKGHEMIVQASE
jgi:hypothetical protein